MAEAEAQVPEDNPLMQAWEKYKASPAYANARKWALDKQADEAGYIDGSLWAAFNAGWNHAFDIPHADVARHESVPSDAVERRAANATEAGYRALLRETAGERLGATRDA